MEPNHVEKKPITTFTKFEIKFARQSGRIKHKKLFLSVLGALLLLAGFYMTMSTFGHLNKDIAGVFEKGDVVVTSGTVEAANAE